MRLHSYVLRYDNGFAPNPFGKYCTLACCKPKIRQYADIGDWVIGTGSKNVGQHKLVYAMKITEKMTFEQYSNERRFAYKIPSKVITEKRGDNIYYKNKDGRWMQRSSSYHRPDDMKDDMSVNSILISEHYFYFGKKAVAIPDKFNELIKKGPGHKCKFDEKLVKSFLAWLEANHDKGRHAEPNDFEKSSITSSEKYPVIEKLNRCFLKTSYPRFS